MLEFKYYSKSKDGHIKVDNLNLIINDRDFWTFVGYYGARKTTYCFLSIVIYLYLSYYVYEIDVHLKRIIEKIISLIIKIVYHLK